MPASSSGYRPLPRTTQRLGGLLVAAAGLFIVWMSLRQAVAHGSFLPRFAMAGPGFLVVGVALVLIPGYREERMARGEEISHLSGLRLLTPRWWVVLAVALMLGLAFEQWLERGDVAAVAASVGAGG